MLNKITFAAMAATAQAGDTNFWKSKSTYQVLTDRFWRDNGDSNACTNLSQYCGGTFKGIE